VVGGSNTGLACAVLVRSVLTIIRKGVLIASNSPSSFNLSTNEELKSRTAFPLNRWSLVIG